MMTLQGQRFYTDLVNLKLTANVRILRLFSNVLIKDVPPKDVKRVLIFKTFMFYI